MSEQEAPSCELILLSPLQETLAPSRLNLPSGMFVFPNP